LDAGGLQNLDAFCKELLLKVMIQIGTGAEASHRNYALTMISG
jgi:hypothetical protein